MEDIVLITGEATRYDYADVMDHISSFDILKGFTAGHYTRPCLSAIHSGTYKAAIKTQAVSPTLAEVLERNGYTCIGLTTNPQADPAFNFEGGYEFYDNFAESGAEQSRFGEFLAQFDIVQKVYHWLFSWHKRRYERPSDEELVDIAVEKFNEAEPPRFLWIHMMGSHRPYGEDEKGISPELNNKAKFYPGSITDEENEEIKEKYADALSRVDSNIQDLMDRLDSDPVFAFIGDHGELLGENGYFHQPTKQKMDDEIVQVPAVFDGIDTESEVLSQIDIAPTLVSAVDIDIPDSWHGKDISEEERETSLTFAPWLGKADVLWQDFDHKILIEGGSASFIEGAGNISTVEDVDKSERVKERLRDFGYLE